MGASTALTSAELSRAKYVLFSVFARYGDSVIAFKAIREFVAAYPDKNYRLITTHQALPYARALIGGSVEFTSVNKRRNPLRMARLVAQLKRHPPDIGFNPWSHGDESEYFASFARRFYLYRSFAGFTREVNLYRRVREYLQLPATTAPIRAFAVKPAPQVLIAPFSTDVRKSMQPQDLAALLHHLRARFAPQRITLAAFADELARAPMSDTEQFAFRKSNASSEEFLALLRQTDVFIGVDAGPLHLASAMGIPTIGIFGPTAPETILDYADSGVRALRTDTLDGVFCDVLSCQDPVCIHQLSDKLDLNAPVKVNFTKSLLLENRVCRAVDKK